jgi:hypothetical protein
LANGEKTEGAELIVKVSGIVHRYGFASRAVST